MWELYSWQAASGRRSDGKCSVQRPKSWTSAARAAPVRLKVAEGITAAARAPAFAPRGRLCAAAREALDAGLGRTTGTPSLAPPPARAAGGGARPPG